VERAISQSFRKEFLNRLDRIVVFRPLTAETMKEILRKELDEVVRRRGLRSREWAVEWEEDALDFLLEQGFTPDLGARPLKRAVERYFLTPLALTIVDHAFPEGDQFLFVRRDGKELRVDFVDPDAPPPASEEKAALRLPVDGLPLRRIVLEPLGTGEEVERLQAVHARLRKVVDGEAWQTSKRTGLEMTSAPGFWDSPERFTILGDVEYIDRIERTLQQSGSLLERLAGPRGERLRYAPGLVQRVAQQLFLLDAACNAVEAGLPRDAFLLLEGPRGRAGDDPGDAFARRLGGMYRAWAEARRMRWEVLEESAPGEAPYRLLLSVAGYAAYALLAPEQGLHVLEVPGKRTGSFERFQTRVRVAPQPDTPPGDARARLEAAREALEGTGAAEPPSVARRYREEPSPLVRDARGWRTGRLERVLAGDFDVISDDS
jgi:ATP-dependent Clp protease ATP-binding subunit ClpC